MKMLQQKCWHFQFKVSPSFSLHPVLYVLIFCFWSEEKANSGMSRSLRGWTFPSLSQKARPPAPAHPGHPQACILAVEQIHLPEQFPLHPSSSQYTSISGEGLQIHKTRELKIKSHHWQTFSRHPIKNYCSQLETPADALVAPPPQRVSNCFPFKHEFRV